MILETIEIAGRLHVVTPVDGRENSAYPMPNYMGTGKALCGILEPGESLNDFISRKEYIHFKLNK
jgi:hypothetical protein